METVKFLIKITYYVIFNIGLIGAKGWQGEPGKQGTPGNVGAPGLRGLDGIICDFSK